MALTLKRSVLLAAGFTVGFVSTVALAQQEPGRNVTVTDRFRPDYSPIGLKQGSFLILPELAVATSYDDNILADELSSRDDYVVKITPTLKIESQWSQHALKFKGSGEIARYASESSEDYENFDLAAAGRIDITRDVYLDGEIVYEDLTESRTSPDDVGAVDPTKFIVIAPNVGLFSRWNRLSMRARGKVNILDFDNGTEPDGTVVINDDRDRKHYVASLRFGYEVVPEYEAFVRAKYNDIDYDDDLDSTGLNRDSNGYEAVAGLRIDLTDVLFGEIFGGYRRQDYDDTALETIDGATYGAALTWNPTRLTTVKGGVTRNVIETTDPDASGYFETEGKVSIDHELLRNVILGAAGSYGVNDYKGNGREDDLYGAGVYGRYLINRNLYLSARYTYTKRDSNFVTESYDKNLFMLRLGAQF